MHPELHADAIHARARQDQARREAADRRLAAQARQAADPSAGDAATNRLRGLVGRLRRPGRSRRARTAFPTLRKA